MQAVILSPIFNDGASRERQTQLRDINGGSRSDTTPMLAPPPKTNKVGTGQNYRTLLN